MMVAMVTMWSLIWYLELCMDVSLVTAIGEDSTAKRHWSKPPVRAMAGQGDQAALQQELAQAQLYMEEQRKLTRGAVYNAQQRLWFETRQKRGPPSTAMSSLATPGETMEVEGPGSNPQATTPATPPTLFQPVPLATEAAFQMTAAQAGVDINNSEQIRHWMQQPVTTRQEVLETMRNYHVGVIRPEIYHLISQVETVIASIDDRLIKTQDSLQWLASENRAAQKRESGLMVVMTGFDQKMSPQERLEQINWMLGEIEEVKQFLFHRCYNASDSCKYYYLSALQCEPSTPPAGENRWSSVTTLLFRSWDLRRAFMAVFGGAKGTPLWSQGKAVKGHHVKCTPSSPQFLRKLELPIRVVLAVLNKQAELQAKTPEPLAILWRTLTIMSPNSTADFDAQAKAIARMIYMEQDGEFKGRLEITRELASMFKANPPPGAEEANLWDFCWNSIAFGIQSQMDMAEKEVLEEAKAKSQGTNKGYQLGMGKVHWSSPFIYSCQFNPYPISLQIQIVDEVSYSWDEYCDKMGKPDLKCGNYSTGTYCGAPATAPTAIPQAAQSSTAAKGRGGRGK